MTPVCNRLDAKDRPRTTEQDAILSDAALAEAQRVTTSWHDHAPTPLVALPSPAQQAGMAEAHLEDEGRGCGIVTYESPSGAQAVGQVPARAASDTSGGLHATEAAHAEGSHMVSDTSRGGHLDMPCQVMQGYEFKAIEAFDALPESPIHVVPLIGGRQDGCGDPPVESVVPAVGRPVPCRSSDAANRMAIGPTPASRTPVFSTEGDSDAGPCRCILGLSA